MAAPTAPRKNFITRDHRYVYLGGSLIALLGLGMFYSAPSPYSFIPAQSVFGTALAAICWFFLGVSAMALLVKWAYWNNYSSTIMKRPSSCASAVTSRISTPRPARCWCSTASF